MSISPRILVVALATMLTSCALFPSAHDRAIRRTPAYKSGYSDGCAAANAAGSTYAGGPVQDKELFRKNKTYRAGWNTGFSACRHAIDTPESDPQHPFYNPNPGG